MLSQMLMLMPQGLLGRSPQWAIAGAAIGVLLWAAGGAFSRYLTTLVAVAIGTTIGMRLPSWLGWQIDGMGTGVAGALLLGLSGYLLHRTWVGLWLALVLVSWSGVAVWLALGHGATLPMPQWHGNLRDSFSALWQALPAPLNPKLPLACAAALTASVVASVFWPKFSKCMTYSLIGTTLAFVMGVIAVHGIQSAWIDAIAPSISAQVAGLLGIVGVGAGLQWWLLPESPLVERKAVERRPISHSSEDATQRVGVAQVANA